MLGIICFSHFSVARGPYADVVPHPPPPNMLVNVMSVVDEVTASVPLPVMILMVGRPNGATKPRHATWHFEYFLLPWDAHAHHTHTLYRTLDTTLWLDTQTHPPAHNNARLPAVTGCTYVRTPLTRRTPHVC